MADNSSKLAKALFPSSKGDRKQSDFDIGKIDPRILKILGLEDDFDLDEEDYLSLLKEKMLLISMGKSKLPREDEELIIEEFKRIKSRKFPKRKITADSFKKGTAVGMNFGEKKITGGVIPKQLLLPPALDKISEKSDIQKIIDALSSIIEQLTLFNKLSEDEIERNRKLRENKRRAEREGELEKGFDGIMKAAEKVIAPVKSILDRIINFLVMTLLGRSLILLLEWFNNKDNKEKVEAIGRFLGDHWPKLLALFIAFGTGLGKFVRGLIGIVIRGTGALIKGATALAARAGIKGAAGALKFLGGPKGKLIGAGLELGAVALGTVALSKGIEDFGGIGGEETTQTAKFSGGGFANFKNLFGNIGGFFSGLVNGQKGVDKVPAMLTDGEFVMSRGAVQRYGVDTLEAMNAAGGGNNKPKVVDGTTYAFGGGFVGDDDLRRMAANHNRGMNLKEISYDPKNVEHIKTFEKLKNLAVKKGVYKPATQSYTRPNVNANVNVNTKSSSASSIVRSQPGALSTNVKPPIESIRTNLNIRGGVGGLKSAGIEMLAGYLMDRGFDKVNAMLVANAIDKNKKLTGDKKENYIESLRNIIDREERWQKGFGGVFDSIIGMGRESSSQKLSKNARTILEGIGSGVHQGGGIKGGFGLKEQSFKDAPKTMVMTDDRGRPFVGHKAMKNGKLTYVRGPQPGTNTTNPLEMLGRMINPGAYKENDTRLGMQNQKIAMVNSLERFQSQGMSKDAQSKMMKQMGGNLKDVQNDLTFRKKTQAKISPTKSKPKSAGVTPPTKPKVKVTYNPAGGGMNGRRGSGSNPSGGSPSVPQFNSAASTRSRKRTASTYGIG